jgi:hypothetical protein
LWEETSPVLEIFLLPAQGPPFSSVPLQQVQIDQLLDRGEESVSVHGMAS